ncbi:MAG: hypothetical protein NTU44_20570 [Bacteroidetes bacterium]|nr:hypothetical protein [Bacteroidota bacterium]
MKTRLIILFFTLLAANAFAQQTGVTPAFWRLTGFSGEVKLTGLYREQVIKRDYLSDTVKSSLITGSIKLNTNSYFWHPNFMLLDVGIEYSPEQSKDDYRVIPDLGETRTLSKLDVRTVFFQNKIISLSAYYNISQIFCNRENLSNLRTDNRVFGGSLYFRNSFLPMSVSYQQGHTELHELGTGRIFKYDNNLLEGRANKSFGHLDRHEFSISRNEFKRIEQETDGIKNDVIDAILTDEIYFDRNQRYRFSSYIHGSDRKGYDTLKRFQTYETMLFRLPAHFEVLGSYAYLNDERRLFDFNQQTERIMLSHRLFESLRSDVYFENANIKQTLFDQIEQRKGGDLFYDKKIPTGQLSLGYHYLLQHQEKMGDENLVQAYREEYILSVGIILLKQPYINQSTVMVWDATGTTLYQLNFDYILVPRGDYIEIQRMPGGQIPVNGTVYIDYTYVIPGSYQYDLSNESWSASLTLFKRFLNIYYRNTHQDYRNLKKTDFIVLNYYTQSTYGCRLEYKGASGGVEYEDNTSVILPYKLTRYFAALQGSLNQRVLVSLNGNYSDYHLVNDNINQQYADVSGQVVISLTNRSKLNIDGGFRQQRGRGIDLDLLNARAEYTLQVRQLYFSLGVQAFRRNLMEQIDNYNGAFFSITRRF